MWYAIVHRKNSQILYLYVKENNMEQYGKEYYDRCKAKGIDYAFYGNWQKQYTKLVVFMSQIYMMDYRDKAMLDIGCACGVNLRAFKETS